jgi:hypothetical protein
MPRFARGAAPGCTTTRSPVRFAARAVLSAAAAALLLFTPIAPLGSPGEIVRATSTGSTPVFAYYYIWYSEASWSRGKSDLPLLGQYNSADRQVIAQHIAWAKESGIDGFIVSWKHDPRLDGPLQTLVSEADHQDFKLILLYEGLNFSRNPIGAQKVGDDLQWFMARYAHDPAFTEFGAPIIVWSGTWKYTNAEVQSVRARIGAPQRARLLGSEKSAADYQARVSLLDGDAYYWSSADPGATPGYRARLDAVGTAVTSDHGFWIAPVTPGFDARLVGGSSVVQRRDGATYRASWAAAAAENPSVLGIISWNEYSENSQIEPSQSFGSLYLDVTRELTGASTSSPDTTMLPGPAVSPGEVAGDSSDGAGLSFGPLEWALATAVAVALLAVLALAAIRARSP